MTDIVKKYHRQDRNQEKVDLIKTRLDDAFMAWLQARPTGKMVLAFEVVANEGGIKSIYVEEKNWEEIK